MRTDFTTSDQLKDTIIRALHDDGLANTKAAPPMRWGFLLLLLGGGLIGVVTANSAAWPPPGDDAPLFAPIGLIVVAFNVLAAGFVLLSAHRDSFRLREPKRRRILALKVVAANLLALAMIFGLPSSIRGLFGPAVTAFDSLWLTISSLAGGVALLLAWRLWRWGQRHESADADAAMAHDRRPPVLYLRSFRDDGDAVLDDAGLPYVRPFMELIAPPTPEQEMARFLQRLGPVIAIGKPGEPLPELGAARLYVAHERWQERVGELMRAASLVVVRVGASAGVLWEIEQALERLPRQRLVLAFLGAPVIAPAMVERLAPVLGASFAAALPEPPPRGWRFVFAQYRRLGSLVYFGADGAARAVPICLWPPGMHDFLYPIRPSAGPLIRAWRKVFSGLGLQPGVGAVPGFPAGRAALAVLAGLWAGMALTLSMRLVSLA